MKSKTDGMSGSNGGSSGKGQLLLLSLHYKT